jgi:hypothetical protein
VVTVVRTPKHKLPCIALNLEAGVGIEPAYTDLQSLYSLYKSTTCEYVRHKYSHFVHVLTSCRGVAPGQVGSICRIASRYPPQDTFVC